MLEIMRNIIDDPVLQMASPQDLTDKTVEIIVRSKPKQHGLTIGWAFGNAALDIWRSRTPGWKDMPEAECYLEMFNVLTKEQVATLYDWYNR